MIKLNNRLHRRTILALSVLILGAITFTSCTSDESADSMDEPAGEQEEFSVDASVDGSDAQVQFFHAWLADCMNDTTVTEGDPATILKNLTAIAKNKIQKALKDRAIVYGFRNGVQLKEELVWGPKLSIKEYNGGYQVTNLIYCVKDLSSARPKYSIGISGTNEISHYAWFNEDFNVEADIQKEWPLTGGNISEGAYTGFYALKDLVDGDKGSLDNFIKTKAEKSIVLVNIAGHSLGGALTQVYSSYIRDVVKNRNSPIVAWVYAGPTAGNSDFATGLVSQLNGQYFAFNNPKDVVPHAWELDRLNELCSIYNGLEVCGVTMAENPAINGVVSFLKKRSAGGDYKMPGEPLAIPVVLGPMTDCGNLVDTMRYLWNSDLRELTELFRYPNDIAKACNGDNDITEAHFVGFYLYFAELGRQHTQGYTGFFFSDSLNTAVEKYMSKGNKKTIKTDAEDILLDFLYDVTETSIAPCDCN